MIGDCATPRCAPQPRPDAEILAMLATGEMFEVLELAGGNAWGIARGVGLVGYVDARRAEFGADVRHERTVFIDGAAGTTGLEIRERLAGRARYRADRCSTKRGARTPRRAREALNDADFVILCLPDDAAREAVSLIDNSAHPRDRRIDRAPHRRWLDLWLRRARARPAGAIAEARARQQSRLLPDRLPRAGPAAGPRRADPGRLAAHRQRDLGLFGRRQGDDRRVRGRRRRPPAFARLCAGPRAQACRPRCRSMPGSSIRRSSRRRSPTPIAG